VDIKWRPRADVVVDATINPDFSQVEIDAPQLSGNAQFALFYPEKRPFFLEGADILEAPFRAIYTRSVTDPAWGVRATQRSERFDGTVLVTRDDGGGLVLLPNTYGTNYAPQDFKSVATFAPRALAGGRGDDRLARNRSHHRGRPRLQPRDGTRLRVVSRRRAAPASSRARLLDHRAGGRRAPPEGRARLGHAGPSTTPIAAPSGRST
jgi:hypothetical protein